MPELSKVVVTGGAGFIGANLCRAFATDDRFGEVVAYDNLSTGNPANLDGFEVQLVEADILDAAALDDAVGGASAVVHLAARPSVSRSIADPMASHEANATGTMQVLEAVRRAGGPHLIVASSSSVYGANPTLPKTEDLLTAPLSPYAASKLATEAYALAHGHSFGLDVLAFRFFNVFGPLQPAGHAYAAVVPAFVAAALAGEALPVHGDGRQTRDFTYIGSLVDVMTDALLRRVASSTPVNLAFGGRFTLLEAIEVLEGILGHPLERRHEAPRSGDVRDSQADQTRLRSLVPDVEPVPFEEGLRHTVDWFSSLS
ncbi:MAG TPA: NAD-dependent epimerase/dehydratase family protein [Acidimicrobiales bacterium]|nr:NAD-dependent epimerase/dehydratase family protein [Acidimicrobiales bacterium]